MIPCVLSKYQTGKPALHSFYFIGKHTILDTDHAIKNKVRVHLFFFKIHPDNFRDSSFPATRWQKTGRLEI